MYKDLLEKFKLPLALSTVGIVLIIGGIFATGLNKSKPNPSSSGQAFPKESLVNSQKTISVDVSGAVNRPGVYKLSEGARLEDAIAASGGFSDLANKEYISKSLNLAQKLADGSKVYVPAEGDTSGSFAPRSTVAGASNQVKVNINTSSQAELEALPGIGPVTASKIISDRPYQAIEELTAKKIVSKAVFEKIKDQIVTY